ncbi:MAG: hypothetical protein G01um101493_8 [Microgenomates group bacterium Gr01-1014_93]|nr:MAG: hypothetical protein G01um101493_8 [Microgenomates group bacterium Gr01-1014_93]
MTEQETENKIEAVHSRTDLLQAFARPFSAEIMTVLYTSPKELESRSIAQILTKLTGKEIDSAKEVIDQLKENRLIEVKGTESYGKRGSLNRIIYGLSETGRIVLDGWLGSLGNLAAHELEEFKRQNEEIILEAERLSRLASIFNQPKK